MISSLKTSPANFLKPWKRKFIPSIVKKVNDSLDEIMLYEADNIADCPWPQTVEGQYAKSVLMPFIEKKVSHYIENIKTDLRVLILGELVLPITINEKEYDNSFVCSPYSYFISYARQSLDSFPSTWFFRSMDVLFGKLGSLFCKLHVNKVVIVNNWLYATNLYPQLQTEHLGKITQFLQQSFPDHTIVFRSVDSCTNPICYQELQKVGFKYIASRQIFFLNPCDSSFFGSRLFKSDLKLLKNSGYEIIDGKDIKEHEISRLLKLYRDLYIGKYSTLNPQFNEEFLRLALKHNILHFKALKKEGRIDGVIAYMERDAKMYCPFFGYDRDLPKETSLYRILSTVLMCEAYERKLFFHQSSGASAFKKMRKAQDCIEYQAVYYKHLKISRHIPWIMLKSIYNSIGKVYMKSY